MTDLRTDWMGLKLHSPLVLGAGPLADDLDALALAVERGASAVVLRSLFEEQVVDDDDPRAAHLAHRGEGARATQHPERYARWLAKVKQAMPKRTPVLASLNGVTPGGWVRFARRLEDAGADALELNLYEVASRDDEDSGAVEARQLEVVRAVCDAVLVPVSVKLSPFYSALPAFARKLADAGARGIAVFNRFYQPDVDLDAMAVQGGLALSTSSELPLRLHALALLSGRSPLALSCTGGVHTAADAAKAVLCGAHTVQVVAAALQHGPGVFRELDEGLRALLRARGYGSSDAARGALAVDRCADPHAYERANYARLLERPGRR